MSNLSSIYGFIEHISRGHACIAMYGAQNSFSFRVPLRDLVLEVVQDTKVWYCHTHQRPEYDEYFAFSSIADRDLFIDLIKIDKMGPSTALALFNNHTAEQLKGMSEIDLKSIKGIGPKTAKSVHAFFNQAPKPPRKKASREGVQRKTGRQRKGNSPGT
jgi:Holliday junction resolvasome RuvABC DNA-binding subunit